MKILLSIPDTLNEKLVRYCEEHDYEKSEFVRKLIREVLEEKYLITGLHPTGETVSMDIPPVTGTMPVENIPETLEDKYKRGETITPSTQPTTTPPILAWCQLHFEKGMSFTCNLITYEDENGTATIEKKWACPKCIEHYQNMGRGRVYFL